MLFLTLVTGCATTYVPLSWNYREKARTLAQSDPTLGILFGHCDPKLKTLRFAPESFQEMMMPAEVKNHLGAYRRDTGIIYRNQEYKPNDQELRDLMVHELAHHCWYTTLNEKQRADWQEHLNDNPSPMQEMIRRIYRDPETFDTEDFAFTVQHARPVDIQALVKLGAITEDEGKTLLKGIKKGDAVVAKEKGATPSALSASAPPPPTAVADKPKGSHTAALTHGEDPDVP